jgi:hypothetical protein
MFPHTWKSNRVRSGDNGGQFCRSSQPIDTCTDRNFRISPGSAWKAFGPSPKFIFKYVTRTPPELDFLLFQPEWNPIYLQSALTIVSLIKFSFNAHMPVNFNELFKDTVRESVVILELEERYKDIRSQVCKVLSRTISGRGQLRKSLGKLSRWDLFPEPDSVRSIRWEQLRITLFAKKNGTKKPEIFYISLDSCNLNQARTQPEHYLCCQAQAALVFQVVFPSSFIIKLCRFYVFLIPGRPWPVSRLCNKPHNANTNPLVPGVGKWQA